MTGSTNSLQYVLTGVAAIAVGAAAIVIQETYKLDATTILTDDLYLKDGPRQALLLAGAALVALGLALTIIGTLDAINPAARTAVFAITLSLLAVTGTYSLLVLAGVQDERDERTRSAQSADDSSDYSPAVPDPEPEPEPSPPPPEPEPLIPEGEASGSARITCDAAGCTERGTPVYDVQIGDGCIRDGKPAEWASHGTGDYRCDSYVVEPPGLAHEPEGNAAVACVDARCYQLSLQVRRPRVGASCKGADFPGTWTDVRRVRPAAGTVYRCLGD